MSMFFNKKSDIVGKLTTPKRDCRRICQHPCIQGSTIRGMTNKKIRVGHYLK